MPKITKAMQTLNKFNILYERDFKIMRTKIQETMKFVHSHTLIAFFLRITVVSAAVDSIYTIFRILFFFELM